MEMQSESINELAAALAKAQGQMDNASLDKTNPHFKSKYASLAAVLDATRAPLSANGLSITSSMRFGEVGLVLRMMLLHSTSGQFLATEYPLPHSATPQQMGSALTYARRYSMSALVNVAAADDDDDANAAQASGAMVGASALKITPDQVKELDDLAIKGGANLAAAFEKLGIKSFGELPASKFATVKAALQDRVKVKKKQQTPEGDEPEGKFS